MREVVKLPEGESLQEWLEVHTIDFTNEICLLFDLVRSVCTETACPVMSAGPNYTYLWADKIHVKQPVSVPAAEYVDLLVEWVDALLSRDEGYKSRKTIFKRMFRVYAHLFHAHFRTFVDLQAEAHLNTCFKRFLFFALEFQLVGKADMEPMAKLVSTLVKREQEKYGA